MTDPISVVVPTYNRAPLIGETLESILSQSYPPAEVIVVDDGSTDATESLVRGFPSTVKYFRIENSRTPAARNVGVSHAASPWIAFCDDDDLWTRNKLAKQIALHHEFGIEYSFTNFRIVSAGVWREETKFDTAPPGFFGKFETTPYGLISRQPCYDDILRFQPIFPSTVLISRRLFESIGGFKPEMGRCHSEDLEFTLRCLQHCPIGAITEPVVGIRKHKSNVSRDTYKQTCSEIEILGYALENHTISQRSRELIGEQIIDRSIDAGEGAFARADFAGCKKWFSAVPRAQVGRKSRMKLMIASLPEPVARALHSIASGLASIWRYLRVKPSQAIL
jgi:glycosyltransferase involved in cell wall biosynthesis